MDLRRNRKKNCCGAPGSAKREIQNQENYCSLQLSYSHSSLSRASAYDDSQTEAAIPQFFPESDKEKAPVILKTDDPSVSTVTKNPAKDSFQGSIRGYASDKGEENVNFCEKFARPVRTDERSSFGESSRSAAYEHTVLPGTSPERDAKARQRRDSTSEQPRLSADIAASIQTDASSSLAESIREASGEHLISPCGSLKNAKDGKKTDLASDQTELSSDVSASAQTDSSSSITESSQESSSNESSTSPCDSPEDAKDVKRSDSASNQIEPIECVAASTQTHAMPSPAYCSEDTTNKPVPSQSYSLLQDVETRRTDSNLERNGPVLDLKAGTLRGLTTNANTQQRPSSKKLSEGSSKASSQTADVSFSSNTTVSQQYFTSRLNSSVRCSLRHTQGVVRKVLPSSGSNFTLKTSSGKLPSRTKVLGVDPSSSKSTPIRNHPKETAPRSSIHETAVDLGRTSNEMQNETRRKLIPGRLGPAQNALKISSRKSVHVSFSYESTRGSIASQSQSSSSSVLSKEGRKLVEKTTPKADSRQAILAESSEDYFGLLNPTFDVTSSARKPRVEKSRHVSFSQNSLRSLTSVKFRSATVTSPATIEAKRASERAKLRASHDRDLSSKSRPFRSHPNITESPETSDASPGLNEKKLMAGLKPHSLVDLQSNTDNTTASHEQLHRAPVNLENNTEGRNQETSMSLDTLSSVTKSSARESATNKKESIERKRYQVATKPKFVEKRNPKSELGHDPSKRSTSSNPRSARSTLSSPSAGMTCEKTLQDESFPQNLSIKPTPNEPWNPIVFTSQSNPFGWNDGFDVKSDFELCLPVQSLKEQENYFTHALSRSTKQEKIESTTKKDSTKRFTQPLVNAELKMLSRTSEQTVPSSTQSRRDFVTPQKVADTSGMTALSDTPDPHHEYVHQRDATGLNQQSTITAGQLETDQSGNKEGALPTNVISSQTAEDTLPTTRVKDGSTYKEIQELKNASSHERTLQMQKPLNKLSESPPIQKVEPGARKREMAAKRQEPQRHSSRKNDELQQNKRESRHSPYKRPKEASRLGEAPMTKRAISDSKVKQRATYVSHAGKAPRSVSIQLSRKSKITMLTNARNAKAEANAKASTSHLTPSFQTREKQTRYPKQEIELLVDASIQTNPVRIVEYSDSCTDPARNSGGRSTSTQSSDCVERFADAVRSTKFHKPVEDEHVLSQRSTSKGSRNAPEPSGNIKHESKCTTPTISGQIIDTVFQSQLYSDLASQFADLKAQYTELKIMYAELKSKYEFATRSGHRNLLTDERSARKESRKGPRMTH